MTKAMASYIDDTKDNVKTYYLSAVKTYYRKQVELSNPFDARFSLSSGGEHFEMWENSSE
jgi:hypothetical protein